MKSPERVVLAGSLMGGLILGGTIFERLIMGLTRRYIIFKAKLFYDLRYVSYVQHAQLDRAPSSCQSSLKTGACLIRAFLSFLANCKFRLIRDVQFGNATQNN